MPTTLKRTQKRIYSFDIIRITAALMVIMVHSVSVMVTEAPYGSAEFTYANFFDSLGRPCVPLFLMLSGALLLNEKRDFPPKKLLRSALQIFIVLVVWSFLYAITTKVFVPLSNGKEIVFRDFFDAFLEGHFHLWYLFMLIGIYLITPILRLFVKRENIHYIVYFLVVTFFAFSLPTFIDAFINHWSEKQNILMNYIGNFEFNYVNEYLSYFLLGWLLTNVYIPKKARIILYVLGVIGFLGTFIGTQFFLSEDMRKSVFYLNSMLTMSFHSIAVFVFLHYSFRKKKFEKSGKILKSLSDLTFGVYLIHCFFLVFLRENTDVIPSGILRSVIEFIATTILSFGSSFIISKIPVVKKIIST